jgi:hypothetical protein
VFVKSIKQTALSLCESAQGCSCGYANTNDIILVLTDYYNWNSVAWLNYNTQKICSTISSMATLIFNRALSENMTICKNESDLLRYNKILRSGVFFDAHCHNVPENRVCDMIYYAQMKTRKQNIQNLGFKYLGKRKVIGLCNEEIINMLAADSNIDWYHIPQTHRIGFFCTKGSSPFSKRSKWAIHDDLNVLDYNNREWLEQILINIRKHDTV